MRKRSPSRAASAQSAAPHAPWHLSRDPILSPWQPPPPPSLRAEPVVPSLGRRPIRSQTKPLGGAALPEAAGRGGREASSQTRQEPALGAGRGRAGPGAPFRLSTQACGRDRNRPG